METATGIMSCAVNVNFGAVFEGFFFFYCWILLSRVI